VIGPETVDIRTTRHAEHTRHTAGEPHRTGSEFMVSNLEFLEGFSPSTNTRQVSFDSEAGVKNTHVTPRSREENVLTLTLRALHRLQPYV
jgi:hypothetical protein